MTRGGDNATEVKRRTGFTFGGFAVVDFSGPVALRPRIGYIQKGSTFSREAEIRGPDGSVIISGVDEPVAKYNYIELSVPVSLQISTSGRLSPRLFAGPSLGRNVKAETEYVESYSDMVRVLDNSDSTRDYQVGLVFGGGFSFGLGEGGSFGLGVSELSFDVRYHLGLSDIEERPIGPAGETTDSSLISFDPAERNQGFVFALGVSF